MLSVSKEDLIVVKGDSAAIPGEDVDRALASEGTVMISTISRNELIERLDRGCNFALVETLPSTAYDQARLPGAINLPPDRISELAATVLPDKAIEIVVYGAGPGCLDSQKAARELGTLGYANVRNYAGGKKDWFEAGLRLEVINNSRQPRKLLT